MKNLNNRTVAKTAPKRKQKKSKRLKSIARFGSIFGESGMLDC